MGSSRRSTAGLLVRILRVAAGLLDVRYTQIPADLAGQHIAELAMPRDRRSPVLKGVVPPGVLAALP